MITYRCGMDESENHNCATCPACRVGRFHPMITTKSWLWKHWRFDDLRGITREWNRLYRRSLATFESMV